MRTTIHGATDFCLQSVFTWPIVAFIFTTKYQFVTLPSGFHPRMYQNTHTHTESAGTWKVADHKSNWSYSDEHSSFCFRIPIKNQSRGPWWLRGCYTPMETHNLGSSSRLRLTKCPTPLSSLFCFHCHSAPAQSAHGCLSRSHSLLSFSSS